MVLGFCLIMLLACVLGLISGLYGIGGNILAIPVVMHLFELVFHFPRSVSMQMAIGTCLVVMVFTSLSSSLFHLKAGNIVWSLYRQIIPFMLVFSVFGAICVGIFDAILLKRIFAGVLFLIALRLLLINNDKNVVNNEVVQSLPFWAWALIGSIVGILSGLMGIGGGIMLIPILLKLGYKPRQVTGTVAACAFSMGLFGVITFILHSHAVPIRYSIGFIYLPVVALMAPLTFINVKIGVRLASQIKASHLQIGLIILILLLAVSIII